MKLKPTNLSQYMNFTKKNKSINKSKFKTVIPNYIDSFSNKYPNYLQSSLNDDIFLLKRKLKGYSKIHSHSSNNTNKNMEINKNMNNKMPITSYINSISPINNYLMKKKKDSINDNTNCINKSSKHHLMLTSINNSSIIYSAKDKGLSYSNNNASNYQSNNNNNNFIHNFHKKSLKNNDNSFQNKNSIDNDIYSQKHNINSNINNIKNINNINNNNININSNNNSNNNLNNNYINNSNINNNQCELLIKKHVKDKKYSITSVNSRKNSIDKDREQLEIAKKLNKLNFNGLFNNNNYNNKRIIYSSKISTNNSNSNNNSNLIEHNNKNFNNIDNINNNDNNHNKNLFIGEFFGLKKGKFLNNFLESYLKVPQSSNNRKTRKDMNIINNNSNNNFKILNNSNNNANSIVNNTISPNNNYPSNNYSPINNNKFFKTTKVSPRTSFPKKKQEFVQSHRVNIKNKLQGNILAFYNNYKNNNANNGSTYGNSYNIENNNINYNNKLIGPINKKNKKNNMSVNMNITYNNKNFNMSNLKLNSNSKNKSMVSNNNNFNKCSSLNKVKNNNNYIENYNYSNNINKNSSNNSYINKKDTSSSVVINNKQYSNNYENQFSGNKIKKNSEINLNNINYNNPNLIPNNNCNKLVSEKIYNLFNKKTSIDIPTNKINKIFTQNQQGLIKIKKNKNKNFTSNNSPINKNGNNNNIYIKTKSKNPSNINTSLSKINNNQNPNPNLITNYCDNSNKNNSNSTSSNMNTYINKHNSNKSQIKKLMLKSKDSSTNNNSKENIKINKLLIKEENLNKKQEEKENVIKEYNDHSYNHNNREKNKTNLNLENKMLEILELKYNLQKNNSENEVMKPKNVYKINYKNQREKDKKIEKPSQNTVSKMSSTTLDSNYYMEKCNSLSKFIKEYYKKNNKYPNTDLNFYLYGRLIGQGAFGKVNIGLNILTGRVVAIKSFNKKNLNKNGDNMKKILYETNLMKKLNHPNITKILEMFEDDDYILIAMEYINGGNLFSFVKKRRKLSEKTAKFLFRQIILGIKHIHSQKIVHRDIKLENILIDLNNNIKICDFGIGRILSSKKQILHDKCGTPMYMAPEILLSSKNKGYEGFPVDIWSSGISLYIMLSGTLPFNLKNNESSSIDEENNNNIELQYNIINKEPKKIEKISEEAKDLLKGLLNKNPHKRLTIDQILNHPWLKSDEKNFKNKKYHLFTKAEMIMLSKTYIDYRYGLVDDLKENFTISNLKIEKNNKNGEKKIKNITTKSSLLAPYNTLIQDNESFSDYESQNSFDDMTNPNINLENDIIIFNNKIKEYNLNYELNNNGECDNGMLINTKTGTISSSVMNNSNIKNETQLTSRSMRRNENEENNDFDEEFNEIDEQEEQEKKIAKILNEIEKIGYDKEYVLSCVNNNILCHASTIFYLMLNYKNI